MRDDGGPSGGSGVTPNGFIRKTGSEGPRRIARPAPLGNPGAERSRPAIPVMVTGRNQAGPLAAGAEPTPQKVHHAKAKAEASQGMTDAAEGSRETALYRSYRDQRIPLEIVCFDGIVIHGYLKAWERFNLIVQTPDGEMLIMKHGIIRILPRAFRPTAPRAPQAEELSDTGEDGGESVPGGPWAP